MCLGFIFVEKKKGIILAIPITGNFSLLNDCITHTALAIVKIMYPMNLKGKHIDFSDVN